MRQGRVFVDNRFAGIIQETDEMQYIFTYSPDYLGETAPRPVSVTMPLRPEPYISDILFPFFFNLLSEGENREAQSQLLHIDKHDDFGFLLATAHSETIGNVTVKGI